MTSYAQNLLDRKAAAPRQPDRNSPAPAWPAAAVLDAPLFAALAKYPAMMKVSQVAEYFAISPDAVLLFRDSGELVFINISPLADRPTWRVTRESVAAFEAKHQTA